MSAARIALIAAVLCMPCVALAQTAEDEAVVSANRSAPPPKAQAPSAQAEAPSAPLMSQAGTVAWLNVASKGSSVSRAAAVPYDRSVNGRTIHGGLSASVGTGGYNSVSAWSQIPVGETGTLGIAVSQTDYGRNGYGWAYGYPYGRGWAGRAGRSQAFALSYLSDGVADQHTPDGCAPGFRLGGRDVEPLWVSRMRATMRAEDDGCDSVFTDRP